MVALEEARAEVDSEEAQEAHSADAVAAALARAEAAALEAVALQEDGEHDAPEAFFETSLGK